MSIKLYVGNVPTSARNSELKELFEKFGKVIECDILKEFAFVHMESDNDAKAAIAGLNDTLWKGGRIRVELSTTKTQKGEPAKRDFNRNRRFNDRGRGGGRGGFNDRGHHGGGGRGGFNDRGKGGFNDRNGNRNSFNGDRNGMRGNFNDRGRGRGAPNGDRGDGRTMSRGGYNDRFGGQRRENGGGPMRDNRFNGGSNYNRPYPDQFGGRNGPPMHREFNGDGYGMRPPMPPNNFNGGPQNFYNGNNNNNMNGFNENGNGFHSNGNDHYMRPPMNGPPMHHQGGPPSMNQGPPNDFFQPPISNGPPQSNGQGQRFNNNFENNNNFNNGPPRQRGFNNY